MDKVVDLRFQDKTGTWTAEVKGKVIEAPTARTLRFDVERTIGDAEVETRVTFDRNTEKEIDALVKRAAIYKKEKAKLDAMLDKLNMDRHVLADRLLMNKCSIEQVAQRLSMNPTRLQQMRDPRQYSGRRVKGLLEGRIQPGEPPQRGGRGAAAEDEAGDE